MRREETGQPLTYASVTVKSPQREGCGGERESLDRDEQDSGASGQMLRRAAPTFARVRRRSVSARSQEAVSRRRRVIGQIKAKFLLLLVRASVLAEHQRRQRQANQTGGRMILLFTRLIRDSVNNGDDTPSPFSS